MLSWHANNITSARSLSTLVWPVFGLYLEPACKYLCGPGFLYENVPKRKVMILFNSLFGTLWVLVYFSDTAETLSSFSGGEATISAGIIMLDTLGMAVSTLCGIELNPT